ncbi:MAG: hypothetical protein WAZ18_02025 [Alphaproteobacteria bacterium]
MTELTFPANHLARVQGKACGATPVFAEVAKRLADRLNDSTRTFAAITNLSVDNGVTQTLLPTAHLQPSEVSDLLIANLTLATLADPVASLHAHLANLKPDGLFLASTLGAASFAEFRTAFHAAGLPPHARTTPLPDVQECGVLLQRLKLAMPVVDRDIITLTFPTMKALVASLHAHASHNWHPARQRGLLSPRQWASVCEAYANLHARPDGRLPLTLEVIYLHGWKPHPTQPKALKPGEGKVSLVSILSPE